MRILASRSPGETRVALLDADDRLVEAWVERAGAAAGGVGDLHRARVTALAPAMAGAFAALAGGETGLLPEKEANGPPPQEGQILAVRVTRAAQGGKGPRVSARGRRLATPLEISRNWPLTPINIGPDFTPWSTPCSMMMKS